MTSPFIIRHMLLDLLTKAEAKKSREHLDRKPHFIPLDPDSLAISLAGKLIIPKGKTLIDVTREVSRKIQEFVSSETSEARASDLRLKPVPITKSVTGDLMAGNVLITDRNISIYTPGAVYHKGDLVGILTSETVGGTSGFQKVYSSLFQKFIKAKLPKYMRDSTAKSADIGHINTLQSTLGISVSQEQADKVLRVVEEQLVSERDLARITTLQNTKNNILSLKSALVTQANFGTQIESLDVIKEFTPGLLKLGVNMIIVQERYQNQTEWAQLEGKFIDNVKEVIHNVNFSRSLLQEISQRVLDILTGKKTPDTKKKVSLGSIIPKSKKLPVTTGKIYNPSPVRSPDTGRFVKVSPASLLSIINFHLHDVVAANMGDGSQRRILNYRTGRFATSAKALSVSVSRDDAINVFYTYMKNPYATFSEGGAMQYPKTRDPKLLISQSIRQIAERLVSNRIRSVVV